MAPLKCCVIGCNATSATHCLYGLPKDDKLRSLWLSFLLPICPKLKDLTPKQLLRKHVCQLHFDKYQMDGHARRLRFGYPCLFTAKEIAYGVPLNSEDYHVMTEHNYFQLSEKTGNAEEESAIRRSDHIHFHKHSNPRCSPIQLNLEPQISASVVQDDLHFYENSNLRWPSTQINNKSQIPASEDPVTRTSGIPLYSRDGTCDKTPLYSQDGTCDKMPSYSRDATCDKMPLYSRDTTCDKMPLYSRDGTCDKIPLYSGDGKCDKMPSYSRDATCDKMPLYSRDTTCDKMPLYSRDATCDKMPLYSRDGKCDKTPLYSRDGTCDKMPSPVVTPKRTDDINLHKYSNLLCSPPQITKESKIPPLEDQDDINIHVHANPPCSPPQITKASQNPAFGDQDDLHFHKYSNLPCSPQTTKESQVPASEDQADFHFHEYSNSPTDINEEPQILATKEQVTRTFGTPLYSRDEICDKMSSPVVTPKQKAPPVINNMRSTKMRHLIKSIRFEPGVTSKVFKCIKDITKYWERSRKLCTIAFNEISINPHLTYNEGKDTINEYGELVGCIEKKCDHALVVMIRGICCPWRQSLAYYFYEGKMPAAVLVNILKEIVEHVCEAGLLPLGLVCIQGPTVRSALKRIQQDTKRIRNTQGIRDDGTIEIAGKKLSIFYNPPHLLKSTRNNFVSKDILYNKNIGTWKDILFIYDIDSKLGQTRTMPKLKAHHVIPRLIKRKTVSVATQALSARTAAVLRYTNAIKNSSTMATTADIVEFFDNLFDSVNGAPGSSKRGKLRTGVKEDSPHLSFWQEAITKLKNMKFKDEASKLAIELGKPRFDRVPCLGGWVTTLESFIRMSRLLFAEYDVDYYYPRYINQDPLENFFGRIMAINYRNNRDADTFNYSFKALVLTNLLDTSGSQVSDCEEDDGETLIGLNYLYENV